MQVVPLGGQIWNQCTWHSFLLAGEITEVRDASGNVLLEFYHLQRLEIFREGRVKKDILYNQMIESAKV